MISATSFDEGDAFSANLADPYAFPYFHTSSEIPALYKAVNSFTAIHANTNISREAQSHMVEKLAKRIIGRSQACPEESGWVDSCGENTCHRFCQLLRFHYNSSGDVLFQQKSDELSVKVLQALIDAEPRAVFTVNNWKETPLHQFVAHCGFEKNDSSFTDRNSPMQDNNFGADTLEGAYISHDLHSNVDVIPPSVKVIDVLLKACPKSIFTVNYEKALPLHEVCTLVGANDRDLIKFPYSSISMRSCIQGQLRAHSNLSGKVHLRTVQSLVNAYRKGLLFLDSKKKTPLYRAVESMHCSSEVVTYILREMESIFSSRNHPVPVKADEDARPLLMRRAILGMSDGSNKILSPLRDLWNVFLHPRHVTFEDFAEIDSKNRALLFENGTDKLSLSQVMNILSDPVYEECNKSNTQVQALINRLGGIWTKMLILMCSAYHGSVEAIYEKDKSTWKPIHAAIYASAPRCIVNTLAKLYADDLVSYGCDASCDTPLTLALSKWDDRCDEMKSNSSINTGGQQATPTNMNVVQILLSRQAYASSIPDGEGRLPLHLAVAGGLSWNEGTSEIYSAYPLAAGMQDPRTLLFPFIAVASKDWKDDNFTKNEWEGKSNEDWLCSIYTLLRADPSIIRC